MDALRIGGRVESVVVQQSDFGLDPPLNMQCLFNTSRSSNV